jgi:hypothetical protein
MSSVRQQARGPVDDDHAWRVVDDLTRPQHIEPAELDAIEAFLIPQLTPILSGRP